MAQYYNKLQSQPIFHWVKSSGGRVPQGTAVSGGHDVNGEKMYIGRALFNGDVIPGKIVPSHGTCYISYGQKEHAMREYQVLCTTRNAEMQWLPSIGGHVPSGAVEGGLTSGGEKLFIGRTFHQSSQVIGKVHPSHKTLYIPFGGKEISSPNYEVLCLKSVA